jgi:hypothetical protein
VPAGACEEAGAAALGDADVLGGQHGVVRYILLSSKRVFSRSGKNPGESFDPTLMSAPMMSASTDVVPLLAGIIM